MNFLVNRLWHVAVPSFVKRWAIGFINKGQAEMAFQKGWAKEFSKNRGKVLEYYEKYRHIDEIRSICGLHPSAKVLDVGCGISTVLHFVEGEKYGIDPLGEQYKEIYDYPEDIDIRSGSGENIEFESGFFDVVFCTNVIDHVEEPEKTIDEIHRTLQDDGFFVLTVDLFKARKKRDPAHPHSMTKEDVHELIAEKFSVVKEYISPWIGLRNYVNGRTLHDHEEIILITKKKVGA